MVIKIRIMRNTLYLGVLVLLLSACTDEVFYEKSYSFKNNEWDQRVKPTFKVEIKDTSKLYDFVITFRNTTDYSFSNCWIYLNSITPDKQKAREPFEIKITNPDGTWIGNKSGTIVENMLYFRQRKFPLAGTYFFRLEQGVIQESLEDVLDIGLRIEEVRK